MTMTDSAPRALSAVDEQRVLLDRLCDEFEQRLTDGNASSIEEFLKECDAHQVDRGQLERELLLVELEIRRRDSNPVDISGYIERFPNQATVIRAALSSADEVNSARLNFSDRYADAVEIGRGGMGSVWRVRDVVLDRPLAVKTMLPKAAAVRENRVRFRREARVTGGLQHPGIPPIVEYGETSEGVPFFSMKLVEGRTLSELLAEREHPRDALPRFLGIFEQICQALGYAHSRAVVHRDLKPANVMVGAFGEVQVMDWGMAKLRPSSGDESRLQITADGGSQSTLEAAATPTVSFNPSGNSLDETAIQPRADDTPPALFAEEIGTDWNAPLVTRDGWVMGTPAYMPPEQARGEIDRIDARSDVFGLGAVLCEILTGERPYAGDDLWQQVLHARLDNAVGRLRTSEADAELTELCISCLAPDPDDRPEDGAAVAEAVREYQDAVSQRLQQEQTARAAAETRAIEEAKRTKVERSKRRLTLALAAAVVVLLFGAGVVAWRYQINQTAEELRSEQARKDIGLGIERAALLRDRMEFQAAATLLEQAEGRLSDAGDGEEIAAQVQQAIADLTIVRRLDEIRMRKATWTDETATNEVGLKVNSVEFANGPKGEYARAIREYGIDVFSNESIKETGRRIAKTRIAEFLIAGLDDWAMQDVRSRKRLWRIADAADTNSLRKRIRTAARSNDAKTLLSIAAGPDVDRLTPTMYMLLTQELMVHRQHRVAATVAHRVAMKSNDFWVRFWTSEVLRQQVKTDWNGVVTHLHAAIAIRPDVWAPYSNLWHAYVGLGNTESAIDAARHALRLNPRGEDLYNSLAKLLRDAGRQSEAEAIIRRGAEMMPRSASMQNYSGTFHYKSRRWKAAERAYRSAVSLDPGMALAHYNLGVLLSKTSRAREAIASFRKAISLDETKPRPHLNLGVMLEQMGKRDEAEDCYRRAVALDGKFAKAHYTLGLLLKSKNQLSEAESEYRKAITIDPNYCDALVDLGILLDGLKRREEAESVFRRATRVDGQNPRGFVSLGLLLYKSNRDYAEALKLFQQAHKLSANNTRIRKLAADMGKKTVRLVVFDRLVKEVQSGQRTLPKGLMYLELAQFAFNRKKQPAVAADLYATAFAKRGLHPRDRFRHQYTAARAAARAGGVQYGSESKRAALMRKRAAAWLSQLHRLSRQAMQNRPATRPAFRKQFRVWLTAPDLANVRDRKLLNRLPTPEREQWLAFWRSVRATIGPVTAPRPSSR